MPAWRWPCMNVHIWSTLCTVLSWQLLIWNYLNPGLFSAHAMSTHFTNNLHCHQGSHSKPKKAVGTRLSVSTTRQSLPVAECEHYTSVITSCVHTSVINAPCSGELSSASKSISLWSGAQQRMWSLSTAKHWCQGRRQMKVDRPQ